MTTIEAKLAEIEARAAEVCLLKNWNDIKMIQPLQYDIPALVKALRIVVARQVVEQNQTDSMVHGVHLTDLDWKNICEAITGENL